MHNTVKLLILATLNFGVWVNLIILDTVILVFLLPTTLKRYYIQIFVARYLAGSQNLQNKGHAKKKQVLQYAQIKMSRERLKMVVNVYFCTSVPAT